MLSLSRSTILFATLLVAGCTVKTNQPLSDPWTTEPDESLYGHWLSTKKENGKVCELHAFVGKHQTKENPRSIMEFVMIGWEVDDKRVSNENSVGYFTVTRIGKTSYMNLIEPGGTTKFSLSQAGSYAMWAKDRERTCTVVRYSCDGKKLQVWNAKERDAVVKKLSIARELKDGFGRVSVIVTAESLARYLQENGGEGLFDDLVVTFSKVP